MKKIVTVFCVFFSLVLNAQLTDIARVEYSFIPKGNSDDQYTRVRALINYPIELKEDTYFVIGTDYNRIYLNLNDNYPFNRSFLETITVIDLNLAYTYKMNEKWRVAYSIAPRLASTLNEKITNKDFFINGGVFFIKDRTKATDVEKPYRLILGLTYNTTTGIPFPLPLVSYYRELNKKWSYTVGIPRMNLKYNINEKNNLQSFLGLDGYFAHLQRPTSVNGNQVDNISLSVIVAGLGYEYQFAKHLVWYAYSGATLRMNNVLRNENRENVFTLDNVNTFYLRTGIKFKI
ncbi:hypothetical protein FDT66_11730 [Polaribacter aestuariivivens]|uniref:DUF6268 domain-containing protein n=1 Tax=Polaribacter aestuariivivens TaxID=2304626 RepID=A0A5S3N159_9FLAO|nr:DUF6268 family outer membrane beta-barrel protein [Polaribacter aestuariivivens]TMM29051.1 hypothetical protein FDT66_11730 [Polaribacter aestuariivivens]